MPYPHAERFVMFRVISWIVRIGAIKRTIHEMTRSNTKAVLDHRGHDLPDAALQVAIICDRRAHGGLSGSDWRDAERD